MKQKFFPSVYQAIHNYFIKWNSEDVSFFTMKMVIAL